MKGMKYHDYIWDLGGTLLDNYETSTAAFVETLALYGITQDHDSVYQALKVSTNFAIETFAPNLENFLETALPAWLADCSARFTTFFVSSTTLVTVLEKAPARRRLFRNCFLRLSFFDMIKSFQ